MRVPAACQTSEPTLVLFAALSGMATGMWHQVTVQMFGARPRVNVAANALVLRVCARMRSAGRVAEDLSPSQTRAMQTNLIDSSMQVCCTMRDGHRAC
jgi:hypothetical protein